MSGAIYFSDTGMKLSDQSFRGFPALWNMAAFYLFLLQPSPLMVAASIVVLAVASFLPFPFIHPVRVVRWRVFNLILLVAWAGLALIAVLNAFDTDWVIKLALGIIAGYFLLAGVLPFGKLRTAA
jgi:phosphatidylcholine synthase